VHEVTGGNPLLLHELLTAVELERIEPSERGAVRVRALGPDTIATRVLRRIAAIGPEASALAGAVAILGDAGNTACAADLAGLSAGAAAGAADELRRVGVLQRRVLAFAHPVVRAAVAASLGEVERERGHARAAELLAAAGSTTEEIALHLLHTAPATTPGASEILRQAAQRALARGAADSAVGYLARALREPCDSGQEADLLFELGVAEARCDAVAAADRLREAYQRSQEPRRLAETAIELAHTLYSLERFDDAVDMLDEAVEQLTDPELRQWLEAESISLSRFAPGLYPRGRARLAELETRFDPDALGGRQLLAILASETARRGTDAAQAIALAERALEGGFLIAEHTFTLAAQAMIHADRIAAGRAIFDEAIAKARSGGAAFVYTLASALRSNASFRLGELAEAEADALSARDAAETARIGSGARLAAAYLSDVLVERGEIDEAARIVERAELTGELPRIYQMAWVLDSRGRLRTAQGRFREGVADCLAAGERLQSLGAPNPSPVPWRSTAALALLGAGDAAAARRIALEEVELARAWGAPRALGRALRVAGTATGGPDGMALLREAVGVLAGSPARLERAYALTELGAALRRANSRAEARDVLAAGLELAHACGATALAERARTELLATGARPRRVARRGVDALTPSEGRVARMASEGQTNREIAQALFVTAGTVETHLSNVYRKLGITARSQLAAALG
jgi:DNA-binding CsgD family transcriptional regulator